MYPTPPRVARALRQLGEHVSIWRKLNRLPASVLAERAGISRDTLRSIEQGAGTASSESVFRVLRVLGVMDPVVAATNDSCQNISEWWFSDHLQVLDAYNI